MKRADRGLGGLPPSRRKEVAKTGHGSELGHEERPVRSVVSRLRDRKKSRRRGTGDWFLLDHSRVNWGLLEWADTHPRPSTRRARKHRPFRPGSGTGAKAVGSGPPSGKHSPAGHSLPFPRASAD